LTASLVGKMCGVVCGVDGFSSLAREGVLPEAGWEEP
jgi:hypothetical protein